MAIHAFFGIAIMMQSGLMVAEWFGAMGRTWGATPLEDQYIGGGVAWSIGELPTLILAITVAIQWSRSDERAQKRGDRHADRTGDAELEAYNARLAALAERDARGADSRRRPAGRLSGGQDPASIVPLRALEVAAQPARELVDSGADRRPRSGRA